MTSRQGPNSPSGYANAEVFTLPPDEVEEVWHYIEPLVKGSCERSRSTFDADWLFKECEAGRAFLIIAADNTEYRGVCIVTPEGDAMRGLALGGKRLAGWLPLLIGEIRNIMRHCGAKRFVDTGRPGLVRLIPGARVIGWEYEVLP